MLIILIFFCIFYFILDDFFCNLKLYNTTVFFKAVYRCNTCVLNLVLLTGLILIVKLTAVPIVAMLFAGLSTLFVEFYSYESPCFFTTKKTKIKNIIVTIILVYILICITAFLEQPVFFIELLCYYVFTIDVLYYIYITILTTHLLTGFVLYFYWGGLGLMGIFYIGEFLLLTLFTANLIILYISIKYGLVFNALLGNLALSEEFTFIFQITIDTLSLLCVGIVVILTALILTFGIEYMLREAQAYNIMVLLMCFSACILFFIISNSFGLMLFFWELSGIFSLFLIDVYYSRIRTTQAVTRSFAISRFSDYWMFLAALEILISCENDALPTIFQLLFKQQFELSILTNYLLDITSATLIIFALFVASMCKCAQFLLFVWLPDAMEAPTPASALIHSSTLVVMGIFMLLRFAPILHLSTQVLYTMTVLGSITIVYGAIFSLRTSDLKKAVAYSTISQIGYLFCGCGFLAFKEVLFYLIVHAFCKALLFVFVGYIVHIFNGTTSLRKMGGLFYITPDIATYVFILCLILAGAPYTIGFLAKELIIFHILNTYSAISYFILACWLISILCTPLYLYRICILPLFGRPRATRRLFRNIAPLHNNYNFPHKVQQAQNTQLYRFSGNIQHWVVQGRFVMFIHFFIITLILFCGEFLLLLIGGFFNTNTGLSISSVGDQSTFYTTSLLITNHTINRNLQLLILILFFSATLYYIILNIQETFSWVIITIITVTLTILIFIEIQHYLVELFNYILNSDFFSDECMYIYYFDGFPDGFVCWRATSMPYFI